MIKNVWTTHTSDLPQQRCLCRWINTSWTASCVVLSVFSIQHFKGFSAAAEILLFSNCAGMTMVMTYLRCSGTKSSFQFALTASEVDGVATDRLGKLCWSNFETSVRTGSLSDVYGHLIAGKVCCGRGKLVDLGGVILISPGVRQSQGHIPLLSSSVFTSLGCSCLF